VAISGASGKTGYRIAEELLAHGDTPRLLLRPNSIVPDSLLHCDSRRLELSDATALDDALRGADALIIATGARPSPDLTGPLRVDAWGVQRQVDSCRRVGVQRVLLVSSFGLILVWKRLGEHALETSGLDWTVIRPGGLSEREPATDGEGIFWTGPGQQESDSIPRRLVARCCLEALDTPAASGRILEVTSSPERPVVPLEQVLMTAT